MPAVLGHDHDVGDGAVEVAEIVTDMIDNEIEPNENAKKVL